MSKAKHDWSRVDAMIEAKRHAAARAYLVVIGRDPAAVAEALHPAL